MLPRLRVTPDGFFFFFFFFFFAHQIPLTVSHEAKPHWSIRFGLIRLSDRTCLEKASSINILQLIRPEIL